MQQVIFNKDLFTHIFSYLDNRENNKIISAFKHLIYYENIRCSLNMLLYGQVQSGKTSKIMEYILCSKNISVLVVQNSRIMLSQYIQALKINNISYIVMNELTAYDKYKGQKVIILINNKFRKKYLYIYLKNNKLGEATSNYSLILDESDQYLKQMVAESIFKKAKDILHVTATPYIINKVCPLDVIVRIKPKENYVGLKQVQIKQINMFEETNKTIVDFIKNIINEDFMNVNQGDGLMLINCFSKISTMHFVAQKLSNTFEKIPVIIVATKTYVYFNGNNRFIKFSSIRGLIDCLKGKNAILLAGRLSSRGINYTNSDYSRNITHQISVPNKDYTNYIQKCRIFGIRNNNLSIKPTIYNLIYDKKNVQFIDRLMKLVDKYS